MAFDGVTIAAVVSELKNKILGGRIYKIHQPETDELCLIIKNNKDNIRLLISADAGLPLVYITETAKENPATAPNFCMLLRKHIGNGRIVNISQPDFERIVEIEIEHLDEMGDLCRKKLITEIMGKHSNIIFTDENNMIIDSIKHISYQISSVREVLPGRQYEYPPSKDKVSPYLVDRDYFMEVIMKKPLAVTKAIYTSVNGFSPVMAGEVSYRAGIDGAVSTDSLNEEDRERLYAVFTDITELIKEEKFLPCIAYNGYKPEEFAAIELTMYGDMEIKTFDSISKTLYEYYSKKNVFLRIRQRSADLRKIVANLVERTAKKYDLQAAQLKTTEKRDKYKLYGELLNVYGYDVKPGEKSLTCINYYDDKEITIPLDDTMSAGENSKRYFARYNKLKRTYEALSELIKETKEELDYLLSVQNSLEIALSENDLTDIKEELVVSGYIKSKNLYGKNKKGAKNTAKSRPLHYISSDGFHIYVGKNNLQNEEISFKLANGNDMWFHAKKIPGSHVIVKTEGKAELPDTTYEEAARLAAYYSSGRKNPKVEIDYTEKKNLKKPPGKKPGFVIYHTNYSMVAEPDIHGIKEIN